MEYLEIPGTCRMLNETSQVGWRGGQRWEVGNLEEVGSRRNCGEKKSPPKERVAEVTWPGWSQYLDSLLHHLEPQKALTQAKNLANNKFLVVCDFQFARFKFSLHVCENCLAQHLTVPPPDCTRNLFSVYLKAGFLIVGGSSLSMFTLLGASCHIHFLPASFHLQIRKHCVPGSVSWRSNRTPCFRFACHYPTTPIKNHCSFNDISGNFSSIAVVSPAWLNPG